MFLIIKKTVQKGLNYEKKNNIDNIKGCLKFKKNCEKSKRKLKNKIRLKNSILISNLTLL